MATLNRCFNRRRKELLGRREARQRALDAGQLPDFLPETAAIREDESWSCAPPAAGLRDRRVEITGPVNRKMVINALNSGATQYMADFEGARGAAGAADRVAMGAAGAGGCDAAARAPLSLPRARPY